MPILEKLLINYGYVPKGLLSLSTCGQTWLITILVLKPDWVGYLKLAYSFPSASNENCNQKKNTFVPRRNAEH